MEAKYYKTYSQNLQREMEYKTYGNSGRGSLRGWTFGAKT